MNIRKIKSILTLFLIPLVIFAVSLVLFSSYKTTIEIENALEESSDSDKKDDKVTPPVNDTFSLGLIAEELDENFVALGFCDAPDGIVVSGYMKNGKASRVYRIGDDKSISYIELFDDELNDFTDRASGIALYDGFLYVCGKGGIYVFYYEDLQEGWDYADYYYFLDTYGDAEWCTVYDDLLYVGNKCSAAEETLITVYSLNPQKTYAIENKNPICAILAPTGTVSAAVFYDGWALSVSDSASDEEKLLFCRLDTDNRSNITLGEEETEITLPLYRIDNSSVTHRIKISNNINDIFVKGDFLYAIGKYSGSESRGNSVGIYFTEIEDSFFE